MRKLLAFLGLAILVFATGCSMPSSRTVTVIHRDGSFDRRVELSSGVTSVTTRQKDGTEKLRPLTKAETAQDLARTFDFDRGKGRLLIHHTNSENSYVGTPDYYDWQRQHKYARGQVALQDVILKKNASHDIIANEASVKPLGDGRWVFEERYHWIGRQLTDADWIEPVIRTAVKTALGAGFDSSQVDMLTARFTRDAIWIFCRPNGPLYENSSKESHASARIRFAKEMESKLNAQAANDTERHASHRLAQLVVGKRAKAIEDSLTLHHPSANELIEVSVRVPGKVVSTDAQLDRNGLWSWTVWSACPAVQDVVLRLVYRP